MTVITRLNMQFELMHVSAFNNYNTFSSDIFNKKYFLDPFPYEDFIYKVNQFLNIGSSKSDENMCIKTSTNNKLVPMFSCWRKKMTHILETSLFSAQKMHDTGTWSKDDDHALNITAKTYLRIFWTDSISFKFFAVKLQYVSWLSISLHTLFCNSSDSYHRLLKNVAKNLKDRNSIYLDWSKQKTLRNEISIVRTITL